MTSASANTQAVTKTPHKDICGPEGGKGGASRLTHLWERPLFSYTLIPLFLSVDVCSAAVSGKQSGRLVGEPL